jgi:4-alpha-glucanotransferase
MNTPGTTEGNWSWNFEWRQLTDQQVKQFTKAVLESGRSHA